MRLSRLYLLLVLLAFAGPARSRVASAGLSARTNKFGPDTVKGPDLADATHHGAGGAEPALSDRGSDAATPPTHARARAARLEARWAAIGAGAPETDENPPVLSRGEWIRTTDP